MEVFFRLRYQTEIKFYISNESLEKVIGHRKKCHIVALKCMHNPLLGKILLIGCNNCVFTVQNNYYQV